MLFFAKLTCASGRERVPSIPSGCCGSERQQKLR